MTSFDSTGASPTPSAAVSAEPDKPEGPISAAILAAGVGAFALGVFTTLAEVSTATKDWLQFSDPVGPLSGKTIMAVVVWLVSWAVLHLALRGRRYETARAFTIAMVLLALGVVGTFPHLLPVPRGRVGPGAHALGRARSGISDLQRIVAATLSQDSISPRCQVTAWFASAL